MSNMFQKRRMILAKKMAPNAICLVESGLLKMRNNDVAYTFRPNSSFYYLTGYKNPNSVLLIYRGKSSCNSKFTKRGKVTKRKRACWRCTKKPISRHIKV